MISEISTFGIKFNSFFHILVSPVAILIACAQPIKCICVTSISGFAQPLESLVAGFLNTLSEIIALT